MAQFRGRVAAVLMLSAAGALLLFAGAASGQQPPAASSPRVTSLMPTSLPYIDGHTHIDQNHAEDAVALLLAAMDRLNGSRAFIQTEPYGLGPGAWDVEMILPVVKKHADRLAVLGGGGTLNPMIIEAATTGNASPEVQKNSRRARKKSFAKGRWVSASCRSSISRCRSRRSRITNMRRPIRR